MTRLVALPIGSIQYIQAAVLVVLLELEKWMVRTKCRIDSHNQLVDSSFFAIAFFRLNSSWEKERKPRYHFSCCEWIMHPMRSCNSFPKFPPCEWINKKILYSPAITFRSNPVSPMLACLQGLDVQHRFELDLPLVIQRYVSDEHHCYGWLLLFLLYYYNPNMTSTSWRLVMVFRSMSSKDLPG